MNEDTITIVTSKPEADELILKACDHIINLLGACAPCDEPEIIAELLTQCVGVVRSNVANVYFRAMAILQQVNAIELYDDTIPNGDSLAWQLTAKQPEPKASPQLRVWWFSGSLNKTFHFPVTSVEEGLLILKALIAYDLYLGDLIVSNGGGIEERQDTKPYFVREEWDASSFDRDGSVWQEWMDDSGNCALTLVDK